MSSDAKKNKIFNNAKGELEKICGKLKPIVKDFMKHSDTLKSNHQVLELIINRQSSKKDKLGSPSYKETRETKLYQQKEEEFSPYATWSHGRMASPVQITISSPVSAFDPSSKGKLSRSPMSFGDLKKYNEFESRSPTTAELRGKDVGQVLTHCQKAFDVIVQKMKHLQNTSYNLLISCDKVANLVQNRSTEEEFVIQVFGNDKKLFENYLNSLIAFVKETSKNVINPEVLTKEQYQSQGRLQEQQSPDYFRKRNQFKDESEENRREEEDYEFKLKIRKAAASLEPFRRDDKFETQVLSSGFGTLVPKRDKSSEKNKEESNSPGKPQQSKVLITNLIEKLKEQTEKCEKLKKENSYMIKLTKKLELKASERKKTLKQLFELVTEKEKELNFYKNNSGVSIKNSGVIEVKDLAEKDKSKEGDKPNSQENLNEVKSSRFSDKEINKGKEVIVIFY